MRLSPYIVGVIECLCLLSYSPAVNAAKGVVVYYRQGCDYYIVETNMGYTLLEWYGGNDPNEGDILVGDYETYGMKTVRVEDTSPTILDK